MARFHTFTSESVSEGHPDKVADYIADSILDAVLTQDPRGRVACEVLCKSEHVVLAGEITANGVEDLDLASVARKAVREIGYVDPGEPFNAGALAIQQFVTRQSLDIARGLDQPSGQGAGDQGSMFGYATDETAELMPLPILLAHRVARTLAEDRKSGRYLWLRPDAKTQVTVQYEDDVPIAVFDVLVSTQHAEATRRESIQVYVENDLLPRALGRWFTPDIQVRVNPTGRFVQGGPSADCGVTGRKIIVDTYGGMARHGGGAFSGKDPSKVDRSAAYFCRYVARQIVSAAIAKRVEIQVSYAIGVERPVSLRVDTLGTGDNREALRFANRFDFRPAAIIERLDLLRPIYRATTNYGHFGKEDLPWEK